MNKNDKLLISSKLSFAFCVISIVTSSIFIAIYLIFKFIAPNFTLTDFKYYSILSSLTLVFILIIFWGFKKLGNNINAYLINSVLILCFPLFDLVSSLIRQERITFFLFTFFIGLLLYFTFYLFRYRYIVNLHSDHLEYKNLLGQIGEIQLKNISKLEQKKSLLFVFKEFKLFEITKKTTISFLDENLDEFEIDFFPVTLKNKEIFEEIIKRANECNNFKIRMYTLT